MISLTCESNTKQDKPHTNAKLIDKENRWVAAIGGGRGGWNGWRGLKGIKFQL